MRVSTVITLLASLVVFGCGGAHKEVKAPESDPWAGYTGKYAEPGGVAAAPKLAKEAKAEKAAEKKAAEAAVKAEKAPEKTDEGAKKASTATIHGESVSSVGLDQFADSAKTATKSKVVSTKYLVGPKYEQLQIQLKGATVQVIRPAANPAPDGPAFSSPKARTSEVSKADAGYYDADADVSVVVTGAGKKAGAEKVLGAVLKR
jgi:hypothetical protein